MPWVTGELLITAPGAYTHSLVDDDTDTSLGKFLRTSEGSLLTFENLTESLTEAPLKRWLKRFQKFPFISFMNYFLAFLWSKLQKQE